LSPAEGVDAYRPRPIAAQGAAAPTKPHRRGGSRTAPTVVACHGDSNGDRRGRFGTGVGS